MHLISPLSKCCQINVDWLSLSFSLFGFHFSFSGKISTNILLTSLWRILCGLYEHIFKNIPLLSSSFATVLLLLVKVKCFSGSTLETLRRINYGFWDIMTLRILVCPLHSVKSISSYTKKNLIHITIIMCMRLRTWFTGWMPHRAFNFHFKAA